MIGWYVHDHGRGHHQRLSCIAAHLQTEVTGLSTLGPPEDFPGQWVRLASDHPDGREDDITAGGTLHWAPLHHAGLRQRMATIATWVATTRPSLMVVDVSVEVAVLVRSMGVPVVVVGMRGDRTDRAHRTAYDLASHLLAPWPAATAEHWPKQWLAKTWHVGAVSRFDGRTTIPAPQQRRVGVLWGHGGSDVSEQDFESAGRATPGWSWTVGATDPWQLLQDSDVVVTHAGQSALAEVAAARRPAIVVPQRRPFGEQLATGRALESKGISLVRSAWPEGPEWPALLAQAARRDGGEWMLWSDGHGGERAAHLLDEAAACAPR